MVRVLVQLRLRSRMRCILILLGLSILIFSCNRDSFISHKKFRKLEVGKNLPITGGYVLNDEGTLQYGYTELKRDKRFFVHLVDHSYDLDEWCMDEYCGEIGKTIKQAGGHFLIFNDAKLTRQYGVDIVHHHKNRLDAKVLIIADRNQKIVGIMENARIDDIEGILKKLHLLP